MDAKPAPPCPDGHGPMKLVNDERVAGRNAEDMGTWWACPHAKCAEMLLRPSTTLMLRASQPAAPTRPNLHIVR
jgi:hypothetical protein